MALTVIHNATIDASDNVAGLSIDPTNPAHVAYTAAGVIGAATVTASVGIVTAAARGCYRCTHRHCRWVGVRRTSFVPMDDDAPASKTEPAAA